MVILTESSWVLYLCSTFLIFIFIFYLQCCAGCFAFRLNTTDVQILWEMYKAAYPSKNCYIVPSHLHENCGCLESYMHACTELHRLSTHTLPPQSPVKWKASPGNILCRVWFKENSIWWSRTSVRSHICPATRITKGQSFNRTIMDATFDFSHHTLRSLPMRWEIWAKRWLF